MLEDDLKRARSRMKELIAEAVAIERLPPPAASGDLSVLQEREKRIAELEHELLEQGGRFESERSAWERRRSDLLKSVEELKSACAAAQAAQAAEAQAWQKRLEELLAAGDPHVLRERAALEKLLHEAREELGARQEKLAASEIELVKLKDFLQTVRVRFAQMKAAFQRKGTLWQRQLQALEAARRTAEAKLELSAARSLEAERKRVEQLSRVLRERLKAERERLEEVSGQGGLLSAVAELESWLAERPAFVRAIQQLRARVLAERQRWSKAYAVERKRAEEASAAREREKKSRELSEQKLGSVQAEAEAALREKAAMEAQTEPRRREKAAMEAQLAASRAEAARQKEAWERDLDDLREGLREAVEARQQSGRELAAQTSCRKQAEERLARALSEAESWLGEKASLSQALQDLKARSAAEIQHLKDLNAVREGQLEGERRRLQEMTESWEKECRTRRLTEEKLDRAIAQAESRLREVSAAACLNDDQRDRAVAEKRIFEQTVRTLQGQLDAERKRSSELTDSWQAEAQARSAAEQGLQRALSDAQLRLREREALSGELADLDARFDAERARWEQRRSLLEAALRQQEEGLQLAQASGEREVAARREAEKRLARSLEELEAKLRDNAAMAKELEDLRTKRRQGP